MYYYFGLGHVRWTELNERRENANTPLIELVSVASKDCEKNLLEASTNKITNRNPWNIVVHCWMKRKSVIDNLWVQII